MTDTTQAAQAARAERRGSAGEVFQAFLKLGLTSFGGPIAHLGYFRDELVVRRGWIDEKGYADLVALCQFLPGPASSQTGFALGLLRGGWFGALAAFTAFTLPSALLLIAFAYGASSFEGPVAEGLASGLKIVAVAIVAQAVWGMARSLCPDRERATIALAAVLVVVFIAGAFGQIAAIVMGALAGLVFCRQDPISGDATHLPFPVGKATGLAALLIFLALLLLLPIAHGATGAQTLAIVDVFYRAGALVFGGGHVVLPLLEEGTVGAGLVGNDAFLAGYGAAQAVPGPLFTFAAYLGFVLEPEPNGLVGAVLALGAIFLPGFLVLIAAIPFWDSFRRRPRAQALMRGTNAAVVGILGAALYDPVFTNAVTGPAAFALALTGFVLLTAWKAPPIVVVLVCAIGGVVLAA